MQSRATPEAPPSPQEGVRVHNAPYNTAPLMQSGRHLDSVIAAVDRALRAVFAPASPRRAPPAPAAEPLPEHERRTSAALMRINHAGELAAQALYHGQAACARSVPTRDMLLAAAHAESDHLAWCEMRLQELGARPSLLNPLWYAGSFLIGAATALCGDRVSLGFVAETERQVEGHLDQHLHRLPPADARSRAILEAMRAEEIEHGQAAVAAGGATLPQPVRTLMRQTARVMTETAHWV